MPSSSSTPLRAVVLACLAAQANSFFTVKPSQRAHSMVRMSAAESDQMTRRAILGGLASASFAFPAPSLAEYKGLDEGRSVPLSAREDRRGPKGVDNPSLLPGGGSIKTNVIDLEKMMTTGQAKKMDDKLNKLEKDTGYKVRVLTQAYPNTPGLAIKDYWGVDDNTVVLVVDKGAYRSDGGTTTNMLNFNVGQNIELLVAPRVFSGLRNLFGGKQYRANGDDAAIETTIDAVCSCLRSGEDGGCSDVPDDFKKLASATKGF